MNDTIARTEMARPEVRGEDDAGGVERRAAVFARELGAVGDVGRLLARRAAVLAGRMERLAERDEIMISAGVEAARDEFDRGRRDERAAWAAALEGDDPERIAEALTNLELSGAGLDAPHRLWGRVLERVRSDDPATAAGAAARARKWLGAMGTGTRRTMWAAWRHGWRPRWPGSAGATTGPARRSRS